MLFSVILLDFKIIRMEQINIYKGSSITFENNDGKVMVNATQMAVLILVLMEYAL